MTEDTWDSLLEHERALIAAQANEPGVPLTGPPEMDTTREMINLLARLSVVLTFAEARVQQMELDQHFTLVNKWTKNAREMVDSLGHGSLAISQVMRRHGY